MNAPAGDESDSTGSLRDFIASESEHSDGDGVSSQDGSYVPAQRLHNGDNGDDAASTSVSEASSQASEASGASIGSSAPSERARPPPPEPSRVSTPPPALPPDAPGRYPKRERRAARDIYLASNTRRVRRVLDRDAARDALREIADWRGHAAQDPDTVLATPGITAALVLAAHARVMDRSGVRPVDEVGSQEDNTDADAEEDSDDNV